MNNTIDQFIDIETLKRFREKASAICDEKYVSLGSGSFSLEFRVGMPLHVSSSLPNEDLIKTFLMDARMFILEKTDKEKKNKFNYENICHFFIGSNFEVETVKRSLTQYQILLEEKAIRLRVDGEELTTRMIFHTILNEKYFHQEKDQKGISKIENPFIGLLAQTKFLATLSRLRMLICFLNKTVVTKYLEIYDKK